MTNFVLILAFLVSSATFAGSDVLNPKASKLFQIFLFEPAITEAYLTGFRNGRTDGTAKLFKRHPKEIQTIVRSNFSEPIIRDAAFIISARLSESEVDEVIKFYRTTTGKKAKEILLKKPTQKLSEVLTDTELTEIDGFYQKGAGYKWITILPQAVALLKDPNGVYAKPTSAKLVEFLKSKKQ